MTTGNDIDSQPPGSDFELIVHVSTAPAAEAAINAGADAVYLSGEGFIRHRSRFGLDWLHNFVNGASQKNARAAVMMPHICDERDIIEWR
ncbi:MAG: hypothetical protein H8E73_02230, partial [Planctomycetes bacterium]|nr:hypothetical protein [Planctomycetota bacterium]